MIMEDTCCCPNCNEENAYFDGVVFVCPDCDYQWDFNPEDIEDV
jgi:protein PhnA